MFPQNTVICSLAAVALLGLTAGAAEVTSADQLKDARQRASYGLGFQVGKTWKSREADIDWDAYLKGARDGHSGANQLLSDQDIQTAMDAFRKDVQTKFEAAQAQLGAKNKEAGDKFLADNKGKDGVKTTASGLQYKVIKMGEGAKPAATDKVTVHYTGTLIDGKKFDSSLDRGEPTSFPLNGVIKGWTEGLQLMPVGSKFQFFIPSDLAYGQRAPASIGPNQVLIFDVELLNIEATPPQEPVTSDIIKVPSAEDLAKGAKPEVIKAEDVKRLIEAEKAKQQPPK